MGRINILTELILPDYKRRHVFTAKLRLVAFAAFWLIYLYFLRDVLAQTRLVAAIVFVSFFVTGFVYYNVMRGRFLFVSFLLELTSDLTAMTAILYLTGGPHSPYYTIYLFYVFVAGVLYNHYLAAIVAVYSALFYGGFLLLCWQGIIPPLILDYGDRLPIPTYTPFAHFLFALMFLGGIIYTVKVASFFSQQREKTLEKRNRELMALHRMTSTIRSANALREVIDHLLGCVRGGLGFEAACLIHFDRAKNCARLYVPRNTPRLADIEVAVGGPLDGIEFPLGRVGGPVLDGIRQHRLIFRRDLGELAFGEEMAVWQGNLRRIQGILGVQRAVIMPIVVEKELLGALLGLSREPFVEEEQVAAMESFANQSALSFEAAAMIDQLKRLNEELAEANMVKSEFLATMSHELRTPLTAIIGFSELLMEGVMGDLNSEQKESLREVLHNSADLLDMINSLLDLTKIESGKMRLDSRPFVIEGVIRRVLNTVSPLVQRKTQTIELAIPDGNHTILGDERKIGQVLLNLIANANKFTPEGGEISVYMRCFDSGGDIERLAPWWWRVAADTSLFKGGGVEIVVEDNGIGISSDHIERIFDMFHQADSSVTRSFGGTGLGLALARRFVEMHGGRIWAESELGKGARFVIVLPLDTGN